MRGEPPWMARAQRAGWALLLLSVLAMVVARSGPTAWHMAALIAAVAAGILGLLALLNIALIRRLYRQIDDVAPSLDYFLIY